MTFIADLHIHSRYSRATSHSLCFAQLYAWARRKGIALLGTGDCTHPGWRAEMAEQLEAAGDGVYRLKQAFRPAEALPGKAAEEVRFLLTGEISTIYKADGVTRKVHHLVCLPSLEAADRFAARLERIGNIAADGRPILGLDSRDLLEILLETSAEAVLIPAHIWTPWFSVLGSKSGFDSVEACYRDLAAQIFAVETGLSSDPPMNWMVSTLDRYTLVSNSDAHSPAKLGREANVFTGEVGYTAVMNALRRVSPDFCGTLEFFPEEGKYHYDGHRKCDFTCPPEESRRFNGRCPVCAGPLTLGVDYRVSELADRPRGDVPAGALPFQSLLSLAEILGELQQTGPTSKKVAFLYDKLLAEVGPELYLLREAELAEIAAAGGELLARAIAKMRAGEIHAVPGYDGEYGTITVFNEQERAEVLGQIQLFSGLALPETPKRRTRTATADTPAAAPELSPGSASTTGLNTEQQRAVTYPPSPLIIVAGPGAGKTCTLVERIAWLVDAQGAAPAAILALTFSNRAAKEMRQRLDVRLHRGIVPTDTLARERPREHELSLAIDLPYDRAPLRAYARGDARAPTPLVATFHKLGFMMIAEHAERLGLGAPIIILSEEEADALFAASRPEVLETDAVSNLDALEAQLTALFSEASGEPTALRACAEAARKLAPEYAARKRALVALDFTDLLLLPLLLLAEDAAIRREYQQRWVHVFVDEYQDVNVLQYLLLRLLCPAEGSLCVIGDPDQAIYGFRGADVRYFLRFQQDYPSAVQLALTRNYRSSRAIVQASTQVIAGHSLLGARELWSDAAGPAQVEVAALPTPQAEAEYVVQTVESLLGGISHFSVDSGRSGDGVGANLGFNDIAVLYRTHRLGEALQQAFDRSGIPYQRAARRDVFQRADVREVLALLAQAEPAATPTRALLEACLQRGITQETLAQPHWSLLLRLAEQTESRDAFLQSIKLERDIDIYDPRAARVTLMTVHAAKGLEWQVVFLLGCEAGSFPHPAAPRDEERRLFYVAMTRARTHLYLSYPESRSQHGERTPRYISPFLQDISPSLIHTYTPDRRATHRHTQLTLDALLSEE